MRSTQRVVGPYCIDLPLHLHQLEQMALRLRIHAGALEVRSRRATVATVDAETLAFRG